MPVPHHYKYFLSVHEISQHLPAKSLLHFQWRAGFFPTQPYFCLSFIRPCTTFDAELFPEVMAPVHLPNLWPDPGAQDHPCGRLPAPGFPMGDKPLARDQNLSFPTSYSHISVWIHHCSISGGQWVFGSSEPLLALGYGGNEGALPGTNQLRSSTCTGQLRHFP